MPETISQTPNAIAQGYTTFEEAAAYNHGVALGMKMGILVVGAALGSAHAETQHQLEQTIAQLAQTRAELAQADEEATHDELTGLLNRRGFMRVVAAELTAHPDRNVAFVVFDLGNFKRVNDETPGGHEKGNETLILLAQQLRSRDPVVGRVGGERSDELAALLNLDDVDEAGEQLTLGERLQAAIGRFHGIADQMREDDPELERVQFYLGVGAYMPTDIDKAAAKTVRELISLSMAAADAALYEDKRNERVRLSFTAYRKAG